MFSFLSKFSMCTQLRFCVRVATRLPVFRREYNSDLLFGYCQPAKDHKVRTIFLIQVFLVYIQYLQIKHA